MKEIEVTYYLNEEQEAKLIKLVKETGHTAAEEFNYLMECGSRYDIDKRLDMEIERRERICQKNSMESAQS